MVSLWYNYAGDKGDLKEISDLGENYHFATYSISAQTSPGQDKDQDHVESTVNQQPAYHSIGFTPRNRVTGNNMVEGVSEMLQVNDVQRLEERDNPGIYEDVTTPPSALVSYCSVRNLCKGLL